MLKVGGNSREAIDSVRRSLTVMESLAAESPTDLGLQEELAERLESATVILLDVGDAKAALEMARRAMVIEEKVVAAKPSDDPEGLRNLARVYGLVSYAFEERGDYVTALEYSRKSSDLARRNFDREPSNARYQRDAWAGYLRAGRQLSATGEIDAAFASYAEATALMESLSAADPADNGHRRWLSVTYSRLGDLHAAIYQPVPALEHYRKAIAISEDLLAGDSDRVETRRDLTRIYQAVGALLTKIGQTDAALDHLKKAEAMAQASAAQDAENARVRSRLAAVLGTMAELYRKRAEQPGSAPDRNMNLRAALEYYRRSLELWQELENTGMLSDADAAKPDELAREIANCDAALAQSNS
jgi:tetratricopeptide (TPR) repeat protein